MVKAIGRAFRWRHMLEKGEYGTIRELAAGEVINESYVGRILRLTLLAPEIVESIVDGRQSPQITLPVLMKGFQRCGRLKPLISKRNTLKGELNNASATKR